MWWISYNGESRSGVENIGVFEDDGTPRKAHPQRGTKRSVLTEANGVPIALAVDGANRVDFKMARETIESIVVARPKSPSVIVDHA